MRLYRNDLGRWATWFAVLRAIASSGAIATWAVVKSFPFVWAGIIAASQFADALREVIPFTANQKAVSALSMTLDALLIEALYEWESIFAARFTVEEITDRRRRLMQLRLDAKTKHFPNGLPDRKRYLALAEQESVSYFDNCLARG
jgi:pyrroloquinoline quinone (PQQ) biosynthesis protein C